MQLMDGMTATNQTMDDMTATNQTMDAMAKAYTTPSKGNLI